MIQKQRKHWDFDNFLAKLVISPTFLITVIFIYGFILWTGWISLTKSTLLPINKFAGLAQYKILFSNDRWWLAMKNLTVFSSLFIVICIFLGLILAIFLDQKIRNEGFIRATYLYPMALSFIVTGTAWRWILNPGLGLQKTIRDWGWTDFQFDWIVQPDMVIYTLVIAAAWQSTGFVMALFLAGLRSIDKNIINSAKIDGASLPKVYAFIVIPSLKPVFFTSVIILLHIAIKSFDLVVSLTRGGPGFASDLPATFMYAYTFTRGKVALGASSAIIMLLMISTILVPYLYSELRMKKNEKA
jgi:glucose/mannose transport system permease protein